MAIAWKILVGGEGGVGKTAIISRYMTGMFTFDMKMTIGVSFVSQNVEFNGKKAFLSIWDLGGQDRFRFVLPPYCKGASGGFILYDMSSLDTLDATSEWFSMFHENVPGIPIVLVGTKFDLVHDESQVAYIQECARDIGARHGCVASILTSSKIGFNVSEAMNLLLASLFATLPVM